MWISSFLYIPLSRNDPKLLFRPFLYSFKHLRLNKPCELGYRGERSDFSFWNCQEKEQCVRDGYPCIIKTKIFSEDSCSTGFAYEDGHCVRKICSAGQSVCRNACRDEALPCHGKCMPGMWYCDRAASCILEREPCSGNCQAGKVWCEREGGCLSQVEWQYCPEDRVCVPMDGTKCPSVRVCLFFSYDHGLPKIYLFFKQGPTIQIQSSFLLRILGP